MAPVNHNDLTVRLVEMGGDRSRNGPHSTDSGSSGDNSRSSHDHELDGLTLGDRPMEHKMTSFWGRSGSRRWDLNACLSRLNRRHFFIGLVVVIALMVFSTGSQHLSSIGVTSNQQPDKKPNKSAGAEGNDKNKEKEKEKEKEPYFCTTWPVDDDGRYHREMEASPGRQLHLDSFAPEGGWKKPEGLSVVAMIFYGRKRNVDILDCYLRQNLVSNGGYLDEVWFMVHTENKQDVEWLRDLTKDEPDYKYIDLGNHTTGHYGYMWEYPVEDDTIYVKIDDDILYIHHDAIPQLVHTRLAQPWPYAISAQLVNGPATTIQQYNFGAILPFLPDPRPDPATSGRSANETWRPADMGLYPHDAHKYQIDSTEGKDKGKAEGKNKEKDKKPTPMDLEPTYAGHSWLLLSDSPRSSIDLMKTPLAYWNEHRGGEIAFGLGWTSWGVAAQAAYSLLHNIARNEMSRYHWGRAIDFGPPESPETFFRGKCAGRPELTTEYRGPGGERLYDMQFLRYNLNFVAIWGADVRAGLPIGEFDEEDVTQKIPRRLRRPFVVDTRAVVGHNSFFTQKKGIEKTDLRDRWRALANELVCDAQNQKVPFDKRCSGF